VGGRLIPDPHSTFQGQTPDEMYFGTGSHVPEQLALKRAGARRARMELNRARRCATCA
jgi:putative transposase